MRKKRDSAYFEERLKKEHPKIYAELKAGHIKSTRQAAAKAGLIHLPSRTEALKREWKRASPAQRKAFLVWVKGSGVGLKGSSSSPHNAVDAAGKLLPAAATFLKKWLRDHRVTPGQIMNQMGFSNFDYTLSASLKGGVLREEVHAPLANWLARNGYV